MSHITPAWTESITSSDRYSSGVRSFGICFGLSVKAGKELFIWNPKEHEELIHDYKELYIREHQIPVLFNLVLLFP